MATCSTCGNDYDQAFTVRTPNGVEYTFDSIECAAARIAPECRHCRCKVLGHGVQGRDGDIYCCANCARESGVHELVDSAVSAGS